MRVHVPAFADDLAPIVARMAADSHPAYLRLGRCEKPKGWTLPDYAPRRRLLPGRTAALVAVGPGAGGHRLLCADLLKPRAGTGRLFWDSTPATPRSGSATRCQTPVTSRTKSRACRTPPSTLPFARKCWSISRTRPPSSPAPAAPCGSTGGWC
jgi:hypothetical protein